MGDDVRMACADANGLLITDVGGGGRNSDGTIFRSSKLGRCLEMKSSDLLDLAPLPPGDSSE